MRIIDNVRCFEEKASPLETKGCWLGVTQTATFIDGFGSYNQIKEMMIEAEQEDIMYETYEPDFYTIYQYRDEEGGIHEW